MTNRGAPEATSPPLGLYVHIPWCVRKCPYCDFNSHAAQGELEEQAYVDALLTDLAREEAGGRVVETLFIGGGTPSLFSGEAITRLLQGIRDTLDLASDTEITLEANPGAVDAAHFEAYREAGVNRLSIGIQSFDGDALQRLGRIHDARQAVEAFETARAAGFENINLDLMFGLPQQKLEEALDDLRRAIALGPEHLSWYQLTLEPHTPFHRHPPPLPADDLVWEMQEQGLELLAKAGYGRYETSTHALEGWRCRHNLNYWRFGDYLGIGAGAHGKITAGEVTRYWKERHPVRYLESPGKTGSRQVRGKELALEFLMNALRLAEGVEEELFFRRTGLPVRSLEPVLTRMRKRGLMEVKRLQATPRGYDFLNDLLVGFET
ncbi:MAG: radical SAM family heme chaperone HemW [Gammaproteobacteria bacterium]|nr:MAG: radical SAM family heme chaperone HemW [Gammaproteobacteria bacterium]